MFLEVLVLRKEKIILTGDCVRLEWFNEVVLHVEFLLRVGESNWVKIEGAVDLFSHEMVFESMCHFYVLSDKKVFGILIIIGKFEIRLIS